MADSTVVFSVDASELLRRKKMFVAVAPVVMRYELQARIHRVEAARELLRQEFSKCKFESAGIVCDIEALMIAASNVGNHLAHLRATLEGLPK